MSEFNEMLAAQYELQVEAFGNDPTNLDPEERAEFIRWNMLALFSELNEALDEVGWKPWASDRTINHELFMKEMVDAWHFFMNLMLAGSGIVIADDEDIKVIVDQFAARYFEKRQINADRQADGYTGTDKCPQCHRDRKTTQKVIVNEEATGVHCPCGYVYHEDAAL